MPKMRWVLRHFTLDQTQSLLNAVMQHPCQQSGQNIVKQAFRDVGLARLIGEHVQQSTAATSAQ